MKGREELAVGHIDQNHCHIAGFHVDSLKLHSNPTFIPYLIFYCG